MSVTVDRTLESLERNSSPAFLATGALIAASLVVPVALAAVSDWSWAAGLVLVGLAVLTVSVGLVGLYPRVADTAPRLALAGAGAAAVAGLAALGLIALVGVAIGTEFAGVRGVAEPMGTFSLLALSMAGGFALGLLLFGAAGWRSPTASRTVVGLLIAGGLALLVPVAVEVVGPAFGITTPAWLLFPVIVALALDTVAIGYHIGPRYPAAG